MLIVISTLCSLAKHGAYMYIIGVEIGFCRIYI